VRAPRRQSCSTSTRSARGRPRRPVVAGGLRQVRAYRLLGSRR
jgi:hypothetical protein